MSDQPWLRLGAAAGILHVVLQFVGFGIVGASVGALADLSSPDREIVRAFEHPSATGVWVGLYLGVLAFLLFAVFTARLSTTLRRAEGDAGWMSTAVFGSGILYIALSLMSLGFIGVGRRAAGHGIDVGLARVLTDLTSGIHAITWGVAALFLMLTATVVLRTRALPRWTGWSAGATAVALLLAMAAPASELAPIVAFLLPLWVLSTAITLLRRSDLAYCAVRSEYGAQPSAPAQLRT